MTFKELYDIFDERFPISLRCEWDNDGIMCSADMSGEVKKVLVALDVTDETVKYACENGFDTIISHHPLVFHSQKALATDDFTQKKLITLIKNNVRVMSFHTRLDAGDFGVNDTLCSLIDFESVEKDNLDSLGRIGTLKKALNISDFSKKVKKALNAPVVSYIGNNKVKKVYVVGGDGKDYIDRAIEYGADTLLTGNASYNSMLDADEAGLNVIEAGHFFTETPVCKTIISIINKVSPEIYTEYFNSNKISYTK